MLFAPATLALGVQVAPPVIRLGAALAMFADRLIESDLRLFNSLLAPFPLASMCRWRRANKQQHAQHCGSNRRLSESCVVHRSLLVVICASLALLPPVNEEREVEAGAARNYLTSLMRVPRRRWSGQNQQTVGHQSGLIANQLSQSGLLKHPYQDNEHNRSQYRDQDAGDETPTGVEAQHAHDPAADHAPHNAQHDIHERSIP